MERTQKKIHTNITRLFSLHPLSIFVLDTPFHLSYSTSFCISIPAPYLFPFPSASPNPTPPTRATFTKLMWMKRRGSGGEGSVARAAGGGGGTSISRRQMVVVESLWGRPLPHSRRRLISGYCEAPSARIRRFSLAFWDNHESRNFFVRTKVSLRPTAIRRFVSEASNLFSKHPLYFRSYISIVVKIILVLIILW